MTNAHGAAHGEKHDHVDAMPKNSAGEDVQLDPDGKSSILPWIGRIVLLGLTVALLIWMLIHTGTLAGQTDSHGHPVPEVVGGAQLMLAALGGIILVYLLGLLIVLRGWARREWHWSLIWLLINLAMIGLAIFCGTQISGLTQEYIHHP